MLRTTKISTFMVLGLLLVLALNFTLARRSFDHSAAESLDLEREHAPMRLPSSGALTALFVGFETMAADVAWIACTVHYGRIGADDPKPEFVGDNARTVATLDPYFHDVYGWYSGFYSQTMQPISLDDVDSVNALLDRGIEHFPDDFWLPFDAGMNYVGGVNYQNPKEKLHGYERAVAYLERASRREGGPEYVPMTVAHLHEEVLQLRKEVGDSTGVETERSYQKNHADFLAEMYHLVDEPGVRQSIESELRESEVGRRALEKLGREYAAELRRRHRERFGYLSIPLWSHVAPNER